MIAVHLELVLLHSCSIGHDAQQIPILGQKGVGHRVNRSYQGMLHLLGLAMQSKFGQFLLGFLTQLLGRCLGEGGHYHLVGLQLAGGHHLCHVGCNTVCLARSCSGTDECLCHNSPVS